MERIKFLEEKSKDYSELLLAKERKAKLVLDVVNEIDNIFPMILEKFTINDNLVKTLKSKIALSIIDTINLSIDQDIATNKLDEKEMGAYKKGIKTVEELSKTGMEKYIK